MMVRRVLKIIFYILLFVGMFYVLYMPVFFSLPYVTPDGYPVECRNLMVVLFSVVTGGLTYRDPYSGHVYSYSAFSSSYTFILLAMFVFSIVISVILLIGLIRKRIVIKRVGIIMSLVLAAVLIIYLFTVTVSCVTKYSSLSSIYIVHNLISPVLVLVSAIPLLIIDKNVKQRVASNNIEDKPKQRFKEPKSRVKNDLDSYDSNNDLL